MTHQRTVPASASSTCTAPTNVCHNTQHDTQRTARHPRRALAHRVQSVAAWHTSARPRHPRRALALHQPPCAIIVCQSQRDTPARGPDPRAVHLHYPKPQCAVSLLYPKLPYPILLYPPQPHPSRLPTSLSRVLVCVSTAVGAVPMPPRPSMLPAQLPGQWPTRWSPPNSAPLAKGQVLSVTPTLSDPR